MQPSNVASKPWRNASVNRLVALHSNECIRNQNYLGTFTMFQLPLFGSSCQSTSSAAASRVRTSARQAEARALRAAGRVYGERCLGLSAKSDQLGSSLRMYLLSNCEALTGLSLHWNESATPAGHWWLELQPTAGTFRENGFGLLPSPLASDYKRGNCKTRNCKDCKIRKMQCADTLPSSAIIHDRHDLKHSPHFRSKLMGWPADYYQRLETLYCEWSATAGATRSHG